MECHEGFELCSSDHFTKQFRCQYGGTHVYKLYVRHIYKEIPYPQNSPRRSSTAIF